jgi:hypothetical protein
VHRALSIPIGVARVARVLQELRARCRRWHRMSRHSIIHLLISRLFPAVVTGALAFVLIAHAASAGTGSHKTTASKGYIFRAYSER